MCYRFFWTVTGSDSCAGVKSVKLVQSPSAPSVLSEILIQLIFFFHSCWSVYFLLESPSDRTEYLIETRWWNTSLMDSVLTCCSCFGILSVAIRKNIWFTLISFVCVWKWVSPVQFLESLSDKAVSSQGAFWSCCGAFDHVTWSSSQSTTFEL